MARTEGRQSGISQRNSSSNREQSSTEFRGLSALVGHPDEAIGLTSDADAPIRRHSSMISRASSNQLASPAFAT